MQSHVIFTFLFKIMEVTYYNFIKHICEKHNVEMDKVYYLNPDNRNGHKFDKIRLKNFVRGVSDRVKIIAKDGSEHPFLEELKTSTGKTHIDRNPIISDAVKFSVVGKKSFSEICSEADIKPRKKKTRICEGGGWTSAGYEYHYDGIYCEF